MRITGLVGVAVACPLLVDVSVYWNNNATDAAVVALSSNCAGLTRLNVSGCKLLSDEGLCFALQALPRLTDLDATRVGNVSDKLLHTAAKHNSATLTRLNLYAEARAACFPRRRRTRHIAAHRGPIKMTKHGIHRCLAGTRVRS